MTHAPFRIITLVAFLGLLALPALAESSLIWIDGMTISRLSADGSAAAGNSTDGTYSPCRWSAQDGVVRLGQSSGELLGRGAGIPDISADGTRISSTIASLDSLHLTQGRWTKGLGWEQTMPPQPPGGAIVDESMGSAWGLSGDGLTVVGYAWHTGGRAYASAWTAEEGMTILDSQDPSRDSRANDASFDGSVVVGWSAATTFGNWNPTVWENGVITVLNNEERWCEAKAVNPAGDIIVGTALDTLTGVNSATMWVKNGTAWDELILGALPGTFGNGVGNVIPGGLNNDGSRVVGANMMDSWTSVGFVWDATRGMIQAEDYLGEFGIAFPDSYTVYEMTAISDDGSTLAGVAYNRFRFPFVYEAFLVTLEDVSAVPRPRVPGLALGPATPNPFNPSTSFALTLPGEARVTVDVMDVRGRLVHTLHDGFLSAGDHTLRWDGVMENGLPAPSGIYFARAREENGAVQTRRMMLVK